MLSLQRSEIFAIFVGLMVACGFGSPWETHTRAVDRFEFFFLTFH